MNVLLVFIGGGVGCALRYGAGYVLASTVFPCATLAVNAVGSFAIGLFGGWASRFGWVEGSASANLGRTKGRAQRALHGGSRAIQRNAILGSYYHKKRAEGHPHKWAIVPTMRKLLSLLNRIARDPGFTPMPEPESTKQNANVGRRTKAA